MTKTVKFLILLLVMFAAIPVSASKASVASSSGRAPTLTSIRNVRSGVRITWKKVSSASGYYVYRKKAGSSKYTKIATITSNSTGTYTDTTARNGRKYKYTVAAYRSNGQRSAAGRPALKTTFLKTPRLMASGSVYTNKISLSWSKSKYAAGYRVYRKENGSYKRIATIKGAQNTTYTDKNCKAGVKYEYKVIAYKGSYKSSAAKRSCVYNHSVIKQLDTSQYYAISADATLSGSGTGYHTKVVIGWANAAVSFGFQHDEGATYPYTSRTVFILENVLSPSEQRYTRHSYNGSTGASLNLTYNLTLVVNKNNGRVSAYVNNVLVATTVNENLVGHTLYCWLEGAARLRGDGVDTTFKNIKIISQGKYTANPKVSYVQTAAGLKTNASVNSSAKTVHIYGKLTSLASNLDWDSAPSSVNGYVRFY